jgi:hypothetical protein
MKPAAISVLYALIIFTSCKPGANQGPEKRPSENKPGPVYPSDRIPEYRKAVKSQAVAVYKERIQDPLNEWYFNVELFETPKTFHYLLKLQFEELRGEDTLILPNFGTQPKPVLKGGKEKYSCLIGFLDKKDSFREYKLVSVKEGREIKLSTLHHYAVDSYIREP